MRHTRRLSFLTALIAMIPCATAQGGGAAPGAVVRQVESTAVADLVILDGGFESELRQGMICRVERQGVQIADLLVVELRPALSASLLLHVVPGQSVRAGDVARVKTLKS